MYGCIVKTPTCAINFLTSDFLKEFFVKQLTGLFPHKARYRLFAPISLATTSAAILLGVLILADHPSARADTGESAASPLEFNRDIRPILADKCFACHGFDAKKREADLRLDTADGAVGESGGPVAIVPGDPESSELWRRITADDADMRMPPKETNKELSEAERQLIFDWIKQGAEYQKHWAFEAPVRTLAPVDASNRSAETFQNPVDLFVAQRLKEHGLAMTPEADRHWLIRRVAFVLTGLPPTPEELEIFLQDDEPGAYERMVDRYLESPHYGEEMARHWLDVARYADTHGMHLDNERQMYAYRDWVVRSFNLNQPFDQFTIEQLAGDLFDNPTQDQLVATGYNRCNVTTSEGGSIDDELLFRYAVDRASTTVQTWLGLTAGCAVCHDHKFDPITQREFYSLYAFFYSAADPAMDGNALLTPPVMKLETSEDRDALSAIAEQIAAKHQAMDAVAATVEYVDPASVESVVVEEHEVVWLEDSFPAGGSVKASPGHPTQLVSANEGGVVFSGSASVKRTDNGLAQDVWETTDAPLVVPANARIFAYVWLDPKNPPQAIMVQFNRTGWMHRAVWGQADAIPWGTPDTPEKRIMGALPAAGEWVRIEFPAADVGLEAGDKLAGLALTQFGGTMYWDKVGVLGVDDPTRDPRQSFTAWWASVKGRDTKDLEASLNTIAKQGPDGEVSEADRQRLRNYYVRSVCDLTKPHFATLESEVAALEQRRRQIQESIPSTFIFKELDKPRVSHVMMRGQYDKPGEVVEPGVPSVLPPLVQRDPAGRATRLDLAEWIVAESNPLTARVAVNRFWQQVFGMGLVKTSYDFGTQGEAPSHPELLDWLSIHFRESGWDVKSLMRMLLCSATFRQDSRVTPELLAKDPENRWYARGARLRLDAEQIRDNALFVSQLLDPQLGGKGVKPYQPPNIWEPVGFAGSNTRFYQQDSGNALYRRSIYTFLKRTAPPPFMSNFDAPNREQFCTRRERSNTPLQALQLMNDIQHVEAARNLAQRILLEGGTDGSQRISFAYRLLMARTPAANEINVVQNQLDKHRARYASDEEAAKALISFGDSKWDASIEPIELASYTLVANMLLNLDETLTRN